MRERFRHDVRERVTRFGEFPSGAHGLRLATWNRRALPRTISGEHMASCIGPTIFVKGQLLAAEDIHIAGRVEGDIQLQEHVLTVQPTADLSAGVVAKSVVIQGAVRGDIVARHSIALQHSASVAGKLAAPRIAINEGASFNGKVETIREA
jgi:cytoskeletal protein CcmA (bactofilin family)